MDNDHKLNKIFKHIYNKFGSFSKFLKMMDSNYGFISEENIKFIMHEFNDNKN